VAKALRGFDHYSGYDGWYWPRTPNTSIRHAGFTWDWVFDEAPASNFVLRSSRQDSLANDRWSKNRSRMW